MMALKREKKKPSNAREGASGSTLKGATRLHPKRSDWWSLRGCDIYPDSSDSDLVTRI